MVRTKPGDDAKKTTYFCLNYWDSFVDKLPQLVMLLQQLAELGEDLKEEQPPETTVSVAPSKQVICTAANGFPIAKIQTLKDGGVIKNFTISVLASELQAMLSLCPQIKQALEDVANTFDLPVYRKNVNNFNTTTAIHKWYLHSPIHGVINSAQTWSFDFDGISAEGSEALVEATKGSPSSTEGMMLHMWRKVVATPNIATLKDSCAMFLLEMGARAILKSKCPRCCNPNMETDDEDMVDDHICALPEDKIKLGSLLGEIEINETAFNDLVSKLIYKFNKQLPAGNYLPFDEIVRHAGVALVNSNPISPLIIDLIDRVSRSDAFASTAEITEAETQLDLFNLY